MYMKYTGIFFPHNIDVFFFSLVRHESTLKFEKLTCRRPRRPFCKSRRGWDRICYEVGRVGNHWQETHQVKRWVFCRPNGHHIPKWNVCQNYWLYNFWRRSLRSRNRRQTPCKGRSQVWLMGLSSHILLTSSCSYPGSKEGVDQSLFPHSPPGIISEKVLDLHDSQSMKSFLLCMAVRL